MTDHDAPDYSSADGERPTLKTIARISGLAVPTVSRALSDAPDIGQKTKEKVQEIAREIGYRRDRAAVRLRTGKTNVIALVIGAGRDAINHTGHLISSIALELRDTSYHVIVMPYFEDESPMKPVRYLVETGSADGIVLNRIQPNDARIAYLDKIGFPFVMHGRTSNCEKYPHFDFDNVTYGKLAVEIMADKGRRHILMVAPPQDQNYSQHMISGATEAAKRLVVTLDILETADSDSESGLVHEAVRTHLTNVPEVDGMIGASPAATMASILGAEDHGRVLGRNFDVVAKEATRMLYAFRPDITVIHEDFFEAGRFMARALVQRIECPDQPPMQHLARPDRLSRADDLPDWMPVASTGEPVE